MMDLKKINELATSENYKERFIAEYWQTKIRYEKLKKFNNRIEAYQRVRVSDVNTRVEEPTHDCPADLLREQQQLMGEYLHVLEVRAVIENVDLTLPDSFFN